jgi:ribosomal 30S subunit maturation factor RimM
VEGEGTEILIPLLGTVLRSVDLEAGLIVLDPPPGLPGLPESI